MTLHFRSDTHTPIDYTRFVHLYDPAWEWPPRPTAHRNRERTQPGHYFRRACGRSCDASGGSDAKPGRYRLISGFYDAQSGGERLAAFGADGKPLTDNLVVLSDVIIEAGDPALCSDKMANR